MPQAKTTGGSEPKKPAGSTARSKPAAAKSSTAKGATSRAAAAKPASSRSTAKPAAAKRTTTRSTSSRSTAAKSSAAKSSAAKPAAASTAAKTDARDAVAARLRKLNEKIIEVGRDAGESTLANYEKALKAIASGLEKTPAKDEAEWVAHLATSQAKFIRDITESWAKAARERLK